MITILSLYFKGNFNTSSLTGGIKGKQSSERIRIYKDGGRSRRVIGLFNLSLG